MSAMRQYKPQHKPPYKPPSHSRRRVSERGHAMLELAVSAAVLVSFLAGTFQFGYTFYAYNQLLTAVGNGARFAAQRPYRAATPMDVQRGETAIRNLVMFGDPHPTADASPVVPGLKPESVQVEWVKSGDGVPQAVRIAIRDFTIDAVFRGFRLDGRPSVEFPFVGRYAPGEREP
jgi:hypothetical protein